MIQKNTLYAFKAEFAKELNIPTWQVDRKQEELLSWLANFYDYDFYNGCPKRIYIKEIYGEYQPLPRKTPSQEKRNLEKEKDYTEFTITSLGEQFTPNSQRRIARDAIDSFGYKKYQHTNIEAVARRFISKSMKEHGESDNKKVWVWYSTYEPLDKETLGFWHRVLSDAHIAEEDAACAFYRQEQGEDISKEKEYYKNALKRFKELEGDIPVLVTSWKLRNPGQSRIKES